MEQTIEKTRGELLAEYFDSLDVFTKESPSDIVPQPTYKLKKCDVVLANPKPCSNLEIRSRIDEAEKRINRIGGVAVQHDDFLPLKHSFADGMYTREIFIPKGYLIVGKIHKHSHPNFLMSGEVNVLTEKGIEYLKGPVSMISAAGTKRLLYAKTDLRWVTVHANVNNETDIDKIMDEFLVTSYADLDPKIIDVVFNENTNLSEEL